MKEVKQTPVFRRLGTWKRAQIIAEVAPSSFQCTVSWDFNRISGHLFVKLTQFVHTCSQ